MPTPTIRTAAAFDIAEHVRRKGGEAEPLFAEAGVPIKSSQDPYSRVELDKFTHLMELASEKTASPDFGLYMGAHQDPSKWGAYGYLVLNSPTVGAALDNLAAFLHPWQTGTHIACVRTRASFGLEYSIIDPTVQYRAQDAELSITYVKHLVDLLCDRVINPDAVHFEHPQVAHISVYKQWLGVEPVFDQPINCVWFPILVDQRRVESADLQLFPILRQHMVDMADATPKEGDLLGSVTYHMRQYLPLHQCTLKQVAKALAMSPQTLQRRLKAEDMVFADMVEELRQDQARDHLGNTRMEVKEISYLLGYADPSAFMKAFKRWTGKTPSQFRESALTI